MFRFPDGCHYWGSIGNIDWSDSSRSRLCLPQTVITQFVILLDLVHVCLSNEISVFFLLEFSAFENYTQMCSVNEIQTRGIRRN